jgi:TolB-like protein
MKQGNAPGADATGEAARRFVRVDAGHSGAEAELASWIAERSSNAPALERIELAVVLGKRLAADPASALHVEAAAAARIEPRRHGARRAVVWGGALAAAVLVAVVVLTDSALRSEAPELAPLRAAELVTVDAPRVTAAVLPSGVVVDAGAVAVLPFATSGDATLAAGLERDVVASLRTVPGLYVIADNAVQPYAATELDTADLGGQLGARGIVDAGVELVDGRVRVSARLREAATGATLWQTDVDRPVGDLGAVRYEIAESVAATLLDPGLREQAARANRSQASVSVGKPLPQ